MNLNAAQEAHQAVHSFWQHEWGQYTPNPPLNGSLTADVAIIGGGYTGLNTAWQFKRDNPNARVMVLEGAFVGFGASGRNAGFSTKLFGLEPEMVALRWGKQKMAEAHHYTKRAVAHTKALIEENDLQSDYQHSGMVRISYSPLQLLRMKKTYELLDSVGIAGDLKWQERDRVRQDFHSERFFGAIYEDDVGHLNPCKQVRELKRLAQSIGVEIHEGSPVQSIDRSGRQIVLRTDRGSVTADKLVVAANAYTRHLPGSKAITQKLYPAWTYLIVTEPLTAAQWESIGWRDRQCFGDNRQMLHYYRPVLTQ